MAGSVKQREHIWLGNAVVDIPAIAAIAHQADRTQRRKLL